MKTVILAAGFTLYICALTLSGRGFSFQLPQAPPRPANASDAGGVVLRRCALRTSENTRSAGIWLRALQLDAVIEMPVAASTMPGASIADLALRANVRLTPGYVRDVWSQQTGARLCDCPAFESCVDFS